MTVTLNATDEPGGSGLQELTYKIDGPSPIDTTKAPRIPLRLQLTVEGTYYITFFSTDRAGNEEVPKTLTVQIDKTPPVISGMPAPGCSLPPNHMLVQVAVVTADDALSGLAPGSFQVTGTSNEPNGDPNNPQIVITPTAQEDM